MRRQYGSYVIIPCKHDAGYDKKMKTIQAGIDELIKKHKELNIEPDFDTLQFIVHEYDYCKKSLDWYADEKGEIDDIEEVITVGIKYESDTFI